MGVKALSPQNSWKWPDQIKYSTISSQTSDEERPAWTRIQTQFSLPFSKTSAMQRPLDEEWIHGVLVGTWTAGGILTLNVLLSLIAIGVSYSQTDNTRGLISTEVYNGNCTLSSRWATGIHIVINLLSTALLEASNYAMQCLSGPSRADVDKAHRKRQWLDIGVMSLRNFRAMTIKRKILWFVLLLSSVPIHMIYNSVIFSSISTLDYGMILIPEDLTATESLVGKDEAAAFFDAVGSTPEVILTEIFDGTFQNMSNLDCLKKYDVQYNTHLGTLVFVADRQYFSNLSSLRANMYGESSLYDYVKLIGEKSRAEASIEEGHWTVEGMDWAGGDTYGYYDEPPSIPISRCMGKTTTQRCRLLFSPSIALAVISFNLAKVICMYLTARTDRSEIFLRVGDAISSFLAQPDPTTKSRCLMSREDMTRGPYRWEPVPSWKSLIRRRMYRNRAEKPTDIPTETHRMLGQDPYSQETSPRMLPTRKRWFQAASKTPWATALTMFALCIFFSSVIYYYIHLNGWSLSEQWRLGFGEPDSETNIQFSITNMIFLVLISNSPQLVFSVLYFLCNTLLSCMLVTAEYNDYATQRKPLRVSWPQGDQRSTYYLSLPYRYSLPLFVLSVTLHWLLSESFFYVNISAYDVHGHINQDETTRGCGFSPIAIFITLILEGVAFVSLLALAIRPFKSPMPLAAHCSAAISAACHPPAGDRDAGLKAVMWGEVASNPADDTGLFPVDLATSHEGEGEAAGLMMKTTYTHCSFTSQEVTMPREDRLYR
ncbi:hypothetical protein BO94DRAFT_588588 [Aspergillus sclerotioniger CBS 115572]|uniref:DUF6536 domain-containing protein n=1 Tax=Aspergillus sclerotioniger CBS 115572 TaxID=1450535 RepID=A0A317VS87_9EURO|nr:hypothetical protein BO94DRAFT_588588 [Aspergillus sclerotioniger CBS 115572]PWY77254.1 hypothetical protein BO94DRAFT_588588 [Aspergillus sclerotioniger CBS 115572]